MHDYRTYVIYGLCVFSGFILRHAKEKRRGNKPDMIYHLITSSVVAFAAYLWYEHQAVTWCSLEFWLMGFSYFGSKIVSVSDDLFEYGIKNYFKMLGNKYDQFSQKDKPSEP